MGDRIGFDKSRARFIPLIGFNGNLFSQKAAGFCCRWINAFVFIASRFQKSFGRGGGYFSQSFNDVKAESAGVAGPPQGKDGDKPSCARHAGGQPDALQGLQNGRMAVDRWLTAFLGFWFLKTLKFAKQTNGMFAVILANFA
jgi:hypothetical protein